MKFKDLTACPFCKCEAFYTKQYATGVIRYKERFDGKEADNSCMYDSLNLKYNDRAYCCNCDRLLGDVYSDTLSAQVLKALKKVKNDNDS